MSDRLKIPYEHSCGVSDGNRPLIIAYFKQHRDQQMKYTHMAVQSGSYREWITQLTEEELQDFMVINVKRIEKALQYKTFGPRFAEEYFWRNALYRLELLYREYGPELSQDIRDLWEEETTADLIYWQGKEKVAKRKWLEAQDIVPQDDSSMVTPYY